MRVLTGALCVGASAEVAVAQAADQLESCMDQVEERLNVLRLLCGRHDELFDGAPWQGSNQVWVG